MYLKSIKITNFRKFREYDNEIQFTEGCESKSLENSSDEGVSDKTKINIAPKTTLIVGKNNSGKTTIIDLLDILLNRNGKFYADDFNLEYLLAIFKKYEIGKEDTIVNNLPLMQFSIKIDLNDNNSTDILSRLYQVLSISSIEEKECKIIIKYQVTETADFVSRVDKLIKNNKDKDLALTFDKFKQLIDEIGFTLKYYNDQGEEINKFRLSDLIQLTYIKANNIREENCLTNAFSKIVEYKYMNVKEKDEIPELDGKIDSVNISLSEYMKSKHSDVLNKTIKQVIDSSKCQILLKSNLSVKSLLHTVIKYYFKEKEKEIPEKQFGLGFTNLIMIVAEILQYMEKYPDTAYNSQINLIAIEEPETFMHPQMQEIFINKINDAIFDLLNNNHKNLNSQIIITTHSPHILNSKIHNGETFDIINYVREENNYAQVISIDDSKISQLTKEDMKKMNSGKKEEIEDKEKYYRFEFIKKHIIFKISEIFFADAVIFVEGICEYNLLQYYISKDEQLSKFFISIVLIDGTHANMYKNLIKVLGIPTLIITDIDIVRDPDEKGEEYKNQAGENCIGEYTQIKSLSGRKTTNSTIKDYMNGSDNLENCNYYEEGNLKLVFQKDSIDGIFSTSFEEAFILTNKDNTNLFRILKEIKPIIFSNIDLDGEISKNSYKFQCKLVNDKARFANKLLYEEMTSSNNTNDLFSLPQYIVDGLNFIREKLNIKNEL